MSLTYAELISDRLVLTDDEFARIQKLVYARVGINLTEAKRQLVFGRLHKIILSRGFGSFAEYIDHVEADASGRALSELSDKISTNYTFFYREPEHFELFRKVVMPELKESLGRNGNRDIRVWCAGCATGEEPYMLAILEMEALGTEYASWKAGLLATDISQEALLTAMRGIYPKDRVDPVPADLRGRYFRDVDGDRCEVIERVRREVTFRRFNLMKKEYKFQKQFHVVFCRNVMIYFDAATKEAVIENIYKSLAPGGWLFIGHSESILRITSQFKYVMPAVYRKV